MSQKVEETLNRINTHQGVLGVLIVNDKGIAIRSTMGTDETIDTGSLIMNFQNKAFQQKSICLIIHNKKTFHDN